MGVEGMKPGLSSTLWMTLRCPVGSIRRGMTRCVVVRKKTGAGGGHSSGGEPARELHKHIFILFIKYFNLITCHPPFLHQIPRLPPPRLLRSHFRETSVR